MRLLCAIVSTDYNDFLNQMKSSEVDYICVDSIGEAEKFSLMKGSSLWDRVMFMESSGVKAMTKIGDTPAVSKFLLDTGIKEVLMEASSGHFIEVRYSAI